MGTQAPEKRMVELALPSLDQKLVAFLSSTTRDDALAEFVASLERAGKIQEGRALFEQLKRREEVGSTAVGMGVAIPHARLAERTNFLFAVGVVKGKGIPWGALDSAPVKLLMLLVGPASQPTAFLQALSKLTSRLADGARREALFQAKSAEEVMAQFHIGGEKNDYGS